MQITATLDTIQTVIEAIHHTNKPHILLHGDLGAGKTTLLKKRVETYGIEPNQVSSPTYTYMNSYNQKILHIDMRRIEEPRQLTELGLIDAIDDHEHVAIERPKRTKQYANTADRLTITITKNDDGSRTYLFKE